MMTLLLGIVDEPITDHYADKVDYTTNKIGGFPDHISDQSRKEKVICKVCGSVTPLLVQVYAPITEKYQYHRTLYIFACINPTCWGNSKSWVCLKKQLKMEDKLVGAGSCFSNEDWISDANNWECKESTSSQMTWQDEAASLPSLFNSVIVFEENANEVSHAFMDPATTVPTAEIEPDENEPITLDSPIVPTCNIAKLLKQKPTSPQTHYENIHFIPFFIYATEEKAEKDPLSEHVQNMLMEYKRSSGNKNDFKIVHNVNVSQQSDEKYEKSHPPHGDKLFHAFMSRIKKNPEQILRYCRRNNAALFLYPETNIPSKCKYCHGDMVFEMQILSTIINYLKLSHDKKNHRDRLEFGSAFVYTCKNSCDKSDEEYVIVQMEKT